jgi:hypothetical protein
MGYCATHVTVEIQVATVVMHAWAQVEHDVVYKTGSTSPLEDDFFALKDIMDTFNIIAQSGESALNQAAYLGFGDAFVAAIRPLLSDQDGCPSLIDIVDLVHPYYPFLNMC